MTEGSELRAFVVVLLIAAAIGGAFVAISSMEVDDRTLVAGTSTTTTASTSTTTAAPLTDEERFDVMCERTRQFESDIAPIVTEPILVMRAAETLYADLVAVAPPDMAAEYEAALDHYTDFNDIGDPFAYDTEMILREGDGLRWEQLVTREPFSVDVTRQHLAFICGAMLPEPYAEDPEDFAEIKEDVDRELNPERYTGGGATTTAPTDPAPAAPAPAAPTG